MSADWFMAPRADGARSIAVINSPTLQPNKDQRTRITRELWADIAGENIKAQRFGTLYRCNQQEICHRNSPCVFLRFSSSFRLTRGD